MAYFLPLTLPAHPPVPSDLYGFCTTFGFLDQTSVVFDLTQVIVYPSIPTCNTMTHVARSLQYKHRCTLRRTSNPHLSHYLSHTLACSVAHTIAQLSLTSHSAFDLSLKHSGIVTRTDLLGKKVFVAAATPHLILAIPLRAYSIPFESVSIHPYFTSTGICAAVERCIVLSITSSYLHASVPTPSSLVCPHPHPTYRRGSHCGWYITTSMSSTGSEFWHRPAFGLLRVRIYAYISVVEVPIVYCELHTVSILWSS